jgi:hypothetical protein
MGGVRLLMRRNGRGRKMALRRTADFHPPLSPRRRFDPGGGVEEAGSKGRCWTRVARGFHSEA